jgi:hypothetical protein
VFYWRINVPAAIHWSIVQGVGIFMRDFGSCLGHWVFAFKYFKVGTFFHYFMGSTRQEVPERTKSIIDWIDIGFMAANTLAALALGYLYYAANTATLEGNKVLYAQLFNKQLDARFTVASLQVISAGFLGAGIFKISRVAKSGQQAVGINVC